MKPFDAYLDLHRERFLHELGALLRVPSVAAQQTGIAEAAGIVRDRLERLGAATQLSRPAAATRWSTPPSARGRAGC